MKKMWMDEAWEDYLYWQREDKKILQKVNQLLEDIDRHGNEGLGLPEPLKHQFSGYWSRRITNKDRLVYKVENDIIHILICKGHY